MPNEWCTEHGEMLVVYDYSANRKVSHLLFHHHISRNSVLRWKSQYNVIKSLACSVRYLLEEWDKQVIHRNITSSTIFFDRDMNPRLCGFALAEFLSRNDKAHQATKKKGSSVIWHQNTWNPARYNHGGCIQLRHGGAGDGYGLEDVYENRELSRLLRLG
ncbi:Protein kinase-like domain superfamily [Arabidopsis suecica]|uniref:Protein kinase-like domain superfamily n=1 Tax=Arabidopsis suecica TaxID=45249 RepID=A0A8T2BR98_ARASU|nr:Protein kinase-like domain superfamily [Arabidopsis suecica]